MQSNDIMQLLNEHYQLRVAEPSDIPEIIRLFAQAFRFKLNAFNIDSTNLNQRQQLEAIWNSLACKKIANNLLSLIMEKLSQHFV